MNSILSMNYVYLKNEIIVLQKRNYVQAMLQFFHVSIIYFNNKLYLLCCWPYIVQTHDLAFSKLSFCFLNDLIPGNTLIIKI